MRQYKVLRTGIWEVLLPNDWLQRTSSDPRSVYFETTDGTKGLYVTTWMLGKHDNRRAEDVAEAFQAAELMSIRKTTVHTWQLLSQQRHETAHSCTAVTDLYAIENYHRIVTKIIVEPPEAVTATFHDYACLDYKASQVYYHAIIDSFRLHGMGA